MSSRATSSGREAVVTERLVTASVHPVRAAMLVRLAARPASIGELAIGIGETRSKVRYHARKLIEAGLIEVAGKRPTRGTAETLYRPALSLVVHDGEFRELGPQEWRRFSERTITLAVHAILASLRSGRFEDRADGTAVHMQMIVDEQGWKEMSKLHLGILENTERVKSEAAERLRVRGDAGFPVASTQFFYELPDPDG